MSTPTTPIIIKRRPSRPDAEDGSVPREPSSEPLPRSTAAPDAAGHHLGYPSEEEEEDVPQPAYQARAAAAPAPAEDAGAPPPPPAVKTARPGHASKAAVADREANGSKPKKAPKKAAAPVAAPAPAAAPAATPRVRRKTKPTAKVSILTVEKAAHVPEGVNTPRSVALCGEHGIPTSELRPRTMADFADTRVNAALAELRYNSYEKRRRAHMAVLLPERQAQQSPARSEAGSEAARAAAAAAAQPEPEVQRAAAKSRAAAAAAGKSPVEENAPMDAETLRMQRQFDEQHNRMMDQERRHGTAGSPNRHTSTARGLYSPGRASSFGRGSPVHGGDGILPTGAMKIQSRYKAENRSPTEGERAAIEDIVERDIYQHEIRERQAALEENRELLLIEDQLAKEKAGNDRVQRIQHDRDREQQRRFFERQKRDIIAQERRIQAAEERENKIQDEIDEKESRIHANDPYTSVLSRRRYSSAVADNRRASVNASAHRRPSEVQ